MRPRIACFALFLAATSFVRPLAAQSPEAQLPAWIWSNAAEEDRIFLVAAFEVAGDVKSAYALATADNGFTLFLNGERVTSGDSWESLQVADIKGKLRTGRNQIAVEATNQGGPAAFIAQVRIALATGDQVTVNSGQDWRVSTSPADGWQEPGFANENWQPAKVLGALGSSRLPWSGAINRETLESALESGDGSEYAPQIATDVTAPEGFVVEKIYNVPQAMGSWVALTTDNQGRLIASDQGDKGLFLIVPGNSERKTKVERLPVSLSGAQGLCWAFDALYAVVNGGDKSGLHRLTDTNGDGLVDKDEHLLFIPGGGEHGPHAVILSQDGKSLQIACGNHTDLPKEVSASRVPTNWQEDHLLPRRWDANGHAVGRMAPGGWICKVNPQGGDLEILSIGYRNQYDIALNGDGELFTYDADMEWDMGSPWYRPTRVSHATSGSEFGWRSGTGKWPTYYEDSLPPAVDIGPGSPTGVVFGYGAKFPAKYQQALYVLDWTYGTIHAVHLKPSGASYVGEYEDFVFGNPLPVTDAIVGHDGAFYFSAGGRGTRSSLYRVTYHGTVPTDRVDYTTTDPNNLRALRNQLEQWHGDSAGNLAVIFANLSHEDRFVRYAARIALEFQDLKQWRDRALATQDARAVIQAMIALARRGTASDAADVMNKLLAVDAAELSEQDRLAYYRAIQLTFVRLGKPEEMHRQQFIEKLDPLFPAATNDQNAELAQLLVYLQAPSVVAKTLHVMDQLGSEPVPGWGKLAERNAGYGGTVARMLENMPPVRGIHYAFVLRNALSPWTIEERRKYFGFFLEAAQHPGGASFPGFLTQMREDALSNVPAGERVFLDELAGRSLVASFESTPPQGPGRKWTTAEAVAVIGENLRGRNYDAGRNLFHATSCAKCHRYNAEGGAIGPDLSTAGRKFALADLLDAIVDPSKVISDQYGSHNIVTADGQVIVGRAVEYGDQVTVYTADVNKPPVVLSKEDIEEMTVSKVSQMPTELVDGLNENELKDLVAYLLSGGDRNAAVFRN